MYQSGSKENSFSSHFEIEPFCGDQDDDDLLVLRNSHRKNSSEISSMKQKTIDTVNGCNLRIAFFVIHVLSCVFLAAITFCMLVKLCLELTMRYYVCLPLALLFWLHNANTLIAVLYYPTSRIKLCMVISATLIVSVSNIVVYGWIIPSVYHQFYTFIFQDIDGTMV